MSDMPEVINAVIGDKRSDIPVNCGYWYASPDMETIEYIKKSASDKYKADLDRYKKALEQIIKTSHEKGLDIGTMASRMFGIAEKALEE